MGRLPVKFALMLTYVDCVIHTLHFLFVLYAAVAAQPHCAGSCAEISIQPVQRVDPAVFVPHLKMQVCPVTVAGIPAVADQLALVYRLPLGHAEFAQMGIQRLQPAAAVIRMAQLEHIAIAVGIPLGAAAIPSVCGFHRATLRSVHGRAHCCAEIQRPVQAAVIVEPARGDNVLGQGPMQQGFFILQPHFYPPYFVLFHIHTDK